MRSFSRSIVQTAGHPLLVLTADLRVVAANPIYLKIFGIAGDGNEDCALFEYDGGRWNAPHILAALKEVGSGGASFADLEIESEVPSTKRRTFSLSARRVVRDEDGTPMVLLAIEDHTERHEDRNELRRLNAELKVRVTDRTAALEKANLQLREANRELAASNRELEAFCYSVSHDLRAPLRAIDGFSQELLESYTERLDDTGQHYLRRIRAGSQRMSQLIDDLLQLSQVTRGDLRRERVDLSALANTVVHDLRERERERSITITIQAHLIADCDPRLIRVVLENLFGNAWKFTSKKTHPEIAFERTPIREQPEHVEFVVRDNGAGFDMNFATKLFGAFQRLHSERDFPGTGIGLATVQRIIRRHGGEVRAKGSVGKGAEFFFTLPNYQDAT